MMKKTSKPVRLYKIIGFCRSCKERFVVDMEQKYASKNYCKNCTSRFKQGAK
ncbi:hypothetical protein HYW20_03800 [Candidatus Woesearchaeota archaeon]|nr:hypothetical protein [Candidatus Woesearchaeota archaeon]